MLTDLDNLLAVSRRYPQPSDGEVKQLLSRWIARREPAVFDRLVTGQLGFVRFILLTNYKAYVKIAGADLFQEGTLGLVSGLQGYTGAEKDFKSYIALEIRRPMNTYVYNRWKRHPWPTSLDAMRVEAIDNPNASDHLTDDEYRELHEKLSGMDPRIKNTLILYYGLGGAEPLTLDKIAAKFGVTRPAVSAYHQKGLAALRGDHSGQLAQPTPVAGQLRHGTSNAYNRHGCRCVECLRWLETNRAERREAYAARRLLAAGR